uniref:Ig-like domain-containing protein n=1 Tax=Poecilia latipinna TaxID=48699 RepID=A0A3B3TYY0_9TELE
MICNLWLTGAFGSEEKSCEKGDFCITLIKEVRGEAGLCVVIPCSYETDEQFTPRHMVWYKTKDQKESRVFNSDNDKDTEAGFKGRVSLLEPDVSQRNCSIMINDLTESDSGNYHFRVKGNMNGKSDGFSYRKTTDVSVSALKQKPSVMVPPLTEGQQATLTCTAPGLCSGDSHIIGNTTALKTENLTAFTQRHSSTLTFNPTAEHHNTKLSCTVSFTAGPTLNIKSMALSSVKEGHYLNLTCSVDSFPPSEIKFSRKLIGNVLQEVNASYYITNATRGDAGLYICTAKHLNSTLTEEINVTETSFSNSQQRAAYR